MMSRISLIAGHVVSGFLLTFALIGISVFSNAMAQASENGVDGTGLDPSAAQDEVVAPAMEAPQSLTVPTGTIATGVLPDPIPGQRLAYFFPSDNGSTATVLYLVNTGSVDTVVRIRGYNYAGSQSFSQDINLPATSMRRCASDVIASGAPPSWTPTTDPNAPATIITNFTDFTYFASISLPKGVVVDGYTLFNPGTGTVDPNMDQGAMPLRFVSYPFFVP